MLCITASLCVSGTEVTGCRQRSVNLDALLSSSGDRQRGGHRPTHGRPNWAYQTRALVHAFSRVQRCGTDRLMDSNMFSTVSAALCRSLVCVCVSSDNEGDRV